MEDALADVEETLPPAAPLQLAGLGPVVDDQNPTAMPRSRKPLFDQDAPDGEVDDEVEVRDEPAIIDIPRERRPVPWAPIVASVVVVLAVVAAAVTFARAPGGSTAVPNVVGLPENAAVAAVQRSGLGVDTVTRENRAPAGIVVEQRPRPGRWQSDGDAVRLVVSRGPPPVPFPELAGQPVDAATAQLQQLGFVVDAGDRRHDEQVPVDVVIASEPAGSAPPDSVVKLVVSAGPAPRVVPGGLAGGTWEAAAAAISGAGLQPARTEVFHDTVTAGQVVGTDPGPGAEVARGSTVSVSISKGPDVVAVPNVRGATIEAAAARLESLGLEVFLDGRYRPGRKVLATDPEPGTQVRRGATVRVLT
jgi:serine/threonine-protein kinase